MELWKALRQQPQLPDTLPSRDMASTPGGTMEQRSFEAALNICGVLVGWLVGWFYFRSLALLINTAGSKTLSSLDLRKQQARCNGLAEAN